MRKLSPFLVMADYFRLARDTGAIANVPRTTPPRTPPGFRLLQAKLFSRRQQCDRFANAPFARFRLFGCMNPNDEVTSVGGRQLPKEFPRFGICLQRLGDVDRQVGDYRSWRVGVARWCRRETRRREQAPRLEFHPPFPIDVRPLARGLSRRDLKGVSVVIETFDKTVDPSEAKRLANGVFVADRLYPCVGLVEHDPTPSTLRRMLSPPRAPFSATPTL